MKKIAWKALFAIVLLLLAAPASAETIFDYQLDSFSVTGNAPGSQSEDFGDGIQDWPVVWGTVSESGGYLHLTNPGTEMAMPGYPSIIMERSDARAPAGFTVFDGYGDFVADAFWAPIVPESPGGYYAVGLDYIISGTYPDTTRQVNVVAVGNFSNVVARNLIGQGAKGGLQVIQLTWTYEYGSPSLYPPLGFGDGLITNAAQYLFDEGDIAGAIDLQVAFTDALDEVLMSFSLDGGETFITPFDPMDAPLPAGASGQPTWLLMGDPMHAVPEPNTALMLTAGLGGLALLGRKGRI